MTPSTPASTSDRLSKNRSSMSVSGKPLCNGEACIGRNAKDGAADAGQEPITEAAEPAAATSSVGVAGQEQCRNDACIGLTDGKPSTRQTEKEETSNKS